MSTTMTATETVENPNTAVVDPIERIQQRANALAEERSVGPGKPARFTAAAQTGDMIWQGDLGILLAAAPPKDFKLAEKPQLQLVPGETQGARHCLSSLEGVQVYLPPNWPNVTELGPFFMTGTKGVTVEHPTHGHVECLPNQGHQTVYQREWDQIQRQARRNSD